MSRGGQGATGTPVFDVCGPLPTGTAVLEASAGTGKTFTIAALATRFVAEGHAELSEVMLVTFGNAASRELRDRVRERMVSAELGLRDPAAARAQERDPVLRLLAGVDEAEAVRRRDRLVRALAGFDAATIATTHSFCSQMLAGLGIAADSGPDRHLHRGHRRPGAGGGRRPVPAQLRACRRRPGRRSSSHPELLELGRRAVGSDRQARLEPHADDGIPGRRRRAAQAVREEVERRKRRLGLVDYDDWLTLLRDALADPEQGQVARERVRARYRVVMVDEFQDTDPVQWEVLRRAFHGHTTLVLIGDPKQAVYGFRGGDVTTYLAAAAVAGDRATLSRNWRSDQQLVSALQQVLGGVALGDRRIVVGPVGSAHPETRLVGAGPPVRLRRLRRTGHGPTGRGGLPQVDRLRTAVAADVAADIVELLSGPARLAGRSVAAG